MSKAAKAPLPWQPVPYPEDGSIGMAIRALQAGNASAGQQQAALRWIVEIASGAYDLSFRPGADGERDTAFAEGRRFVGLQIIKQTKLIVKPK